MERLNRFVRALKRKVSVVCAELLVWINDISGILDAINKMVQKIKAVYLAIIWIIRRLRAMFETLYELIECFKDWF